MAKAQVPFYALNVGEVDARALGRIDLEKMRLASKTMVNYIPTVLGPMGIRPGTKYITPTYNNQKARLIPFIYNSVTTALVELTGNGMRVLNNGVPITYPSLSTTITNGNFASAIGTGWTNQSTGVGAAAISGSKLTLTTGKYSYGRARNTVTVASGDQAKLHCVKIVVDRGPVIFRVGTSAGGGQLISSQSLSEGEHFIAFTPGTGTVYLDLEAIEPTGIDRIVSLCNIVQGQEMRVTSPWAEADLDKIRYAQSGSILFIACAGKQQYRIERRGTNSWSVVKYYTNAGPYLLASSRREQMKPSGLTGNVTITCNENYFNANHVGTLIEMTHPKQRVSFRFTGSDQYSDYIRVTGVGSGDRTFYLNITAITGGSASISLERAYGIPEGWTETSTYTTTGSRSNDDSNNSNNQIVYYRLSVRPGATFSASSVDITLTYDGGAKVGIARITGYSSQTSVSAEVLSSFGDTNYTADWREGAWSSNSSWPSSVVFHDGRLWWAGLDKVYGSVSDDYGNFDPLTEGDAGPIVRSIATGPVEGIVWMLSLQRLLVGTASAEVSIRSSSFDEPLTPQQFTARRASTYGCGDVQAITVDSAGIFVQRNRQKVLELRYDVDVNDYAPSELTRLNQSICSPGVIDACIQRQPDTRVWFVKSDGKLALLVYDRKDNVIGWCRIELDGEIETIASLPSASDDDIYVVVKRTIDGVTKRYIEKFSQQDEIEGATDCYVMDSAFRWTSGTATTAVTGLTHLAGKQVVVWSDGAALHDQNNLATVSSSGTLTLAQAKTSAIIGLPFNADFKSVKLAYASQAGTAINQRKRVDHLSIYANHLAPDGVLIGRSFAALSKLSRIYKGKPLTASQVISEYDYDASNFNGSWDTDSRVCIRTQAPYPALIAGLVISMETNDRG